MDYANSFRKVFTCSATGTQYSGWFDISKYNELYSWLTFSETGTANSETIDVTLERYVPYVTPTATTVLTHGQIAAAGNSEVYGSWMADTAAPGTENKLGTRVRYKCIAGGTFGSGNVITVTMILHAKRN